MPSARELEVLFEEGGLGDMLAVTFNGERGHTYPMKDSEFMIGFKNEEETPSIDLIRPKVIEFYQKLGYEVEINRNFSGHDSFTAVIHHDRNKVSWHAFVVTVTTNYPITPGEKKSFLRVTCLRI